MGANEAAAALGRLGGMARRENLTPEQRSEVAKLGGHARWATQEDNMVEQFRGTLRRQEGREERIAMLARAFVRRVNLIGPRALVYHDYEVSDATPAVAAMAGYGKSVLGVFRAGVSVSDVRAEILAAVGVMK